MPGAECRWPPPLRVLTALLVLLAGAAGAARASPLAELPACSALAERALADRCAARQRVRSRTARAPRQAWPGKRTRPLSSRTCSCALPSNATAQLASSIAAFAAQGCGPGNASVLDVLLGPGYALPAGLLERVQSDTGWSVRVTQWSLARRGELTPAAFAAFDAAVVDSELLAGLGSAGWLRLPAQLLSPPQLAALQAAQPTPLRRYATAYRFQPASFPVGLDALALYADQRALSWLAARPALRDRLGLPLPSSTPSASLQWSWSQLLEAVAAVHGAALAGAEAPRAGLCLDLAPDCMAGALLQGLAAGLQQRTGPSSGFLADPASPGPGASWRLDSAGMRAALWLLQRLGAYGPTGQSEGTAPGPSAASCRQLSVDFAEGRCAFALHGLRHWAAARAWPGRDNATLAATRVLPLPGALKGAAAAVPAGAGGPGAPPAPPVSRAPQAAPGWTLAAPTWPAAGSPARARWQCRPRARPRGWSTRLGCCWAALWLWWPAPRPRPHGPPRHVWRRCCRQRRARARSAASQAAVGGAPQGRGRAATSTSEGAF
jgi:hypothetical protein